MVFVTGPEEEQEKRGKVSAPRVTHSVSCDAKSGASHLGSNDIGVEEARRGVHAEGCQGPRQGGSPTRS